MSRPWKRGARTVDAEARERRGHEAHDASIGGAADQRREQAVIGRKKAVPAGLDRDDVPGGSDSRVDHGDVHGPGRKVPVRPAQPETRFRRPVHHDLVRQVDDPRRGKARQDHTLYHADERSLVAEVGGDGHHTARVKQALAQLRAPRPRGLLFASAHARQRSVLGTAASRSGSMSSPHTAQFE